MSDLTTETKHLAKHSSIYAIGNLLEKVTAFLLLPIYTRHLTPRDYGIKELVGISSDVIVILVATAIATSLYRFYFEYDEEEDRRQVMSSAFVSLGLGTAVAVAGLVLLARPLAGVVLDDPGLSIYMILPFISLWFKVLNNISRLYLRAQQKSLLVITYSVLQLVLSFSLNIYFIVGRGMGVLGILYSVLIVAVFIFLVMTVPIIIKTGLRFSWAKTREMFIFGLPLVPSTLGGFVVHMSDRFFLKHYGSIADAGLYSLGYRLGGMPGTFVMQPFNMTWLPRRFEIQKQKDAETIFGRIFTYYLLAMVLAGLGISALARDMVMLMADPTFWPAHRVVPLVVIANILFSLHYHLHFGLILAKRTKVLAAINLSDGALVLLLNWLLIPRYGMFGAVYATILAFLYKDILTWIYSKKYFRPRFEAVRIAKIFLAGGAIYTASLLLSVGVLWWDILLHLGLVSLYPLLLEGLRFFTVAEKTKAKDFIRAKLPRGI